MREYITNERSDIKETADNALAKNNPKTISAYLKRFKTFCRYLPREDLYVVLNEKIDEFDRKRTLGKLSATSIRQYKAAIRFCVSLVAFDTDSNKEMMLSDELIWAIKAIKQSLTLPQSHIIFDKNNALLEEETYKQTKKRDFLAHSNGKSSSKKLKFVPKGFIDALGNACKDETENKYIKLAYTFFKANVLVGLRPAEWYDAIILSVDELKETPHFKQQIKQTQDAVLSDGEKVAIGAVYLCLKNFKNSYGRACGDYRYICLDNLSQREFMCITDWMRKSNEFIDKLNIIDADDYYHRFMSKIQDAVRYLSKNDKKIIKIISSDYAKKSATYLSDQKRANANLKPFNSKPVVRGSVTLYSTRHQAVANAKKAGFSDLQIAALFGHSSIHTAKEHYGKVGSASGSSKLSPHPVNMKQVLVKSKAFKQQLEMIKNRDKVVDTKPQYNPSQNEPGFEL